MHTQIGHQSINVEYFQMFSSRHDAKQSINVVEDDGPPHPGEPWVPWGIPGYPGAPGEEESREKLFISEFSNKMQRQFSTAVFFKICCGTE